MGKKVCTHPSILWCVVEQSTKQTYQKYRMSANNSGVLGTEYEEVERVVNRSDDD